MTLFSDATRYGLFGLFFCLLLVLAPDVLPLLAGQDGGAWTPVNSPLYRFGDNYYYAAWVHQGLEGGFPPGSPSAAEFQSKALMETLRWFPLFVAALPGYIFHDFRIVYVLDYAFTAIAFFGIPFLMAWRFTRSGLAALAVGIAVLFGNAQWWSQIPSSVGMPGASGVFTWFGILLGYAVHGSGDLLRMYEYEALQGSFRYINLSVSGPILLGYCMLAHMVHADAKPRLAWALPLAVLSPFMAFSYPSQALIAYAALGLYGIAAVARKHTAAAAWLFGIGLATAAILVAGGYIPYITDVFRQNALWNNIFSHESLHFRDLPWWQYPFMLVVNKYTVTGAVALYLTRKNRELRDMVLVFLTIACGLCITTLFDMPQLWARFLGRGIDPVWFTVMLIAFVYGAIHTVTNEKIIRLRYAAVAIVLAIPALAFGIYAAHSAVNGTRYMPQTRWDFLQWVDTHVPQNETVAALNWDDITFIPIYTGANLMVDNMIIGGRGPEESLSRYLALWKFLGYPRNVLEQRLTTMTGFAHQRFAVAGSRKKSLNPPFLTQDQYASAQIAEALVYWPYVDHVFGQVVAENNATTPALVRHLMALYDRMDAKDAVRTYPFRYVAISGVEAELPVKSTVPLELVYENATHKIYRIVP